MLEGFGQSLRAMSASYEKEQIIIGIKDNGIGMKQEELQTLRASMLRQPSNDSNIGIGLSNVNERIRLNYGTQYGLEIDSIYQEGTEVTIYLPAALS
jgi:two-component system sensor histidine kinase YesM